MAAHSADKYRERSLNYRKKRHLRQISNKVQLDLRGSLKGLQTVKSSCTDPIELGGLRGGGSAISAPRAPAAHGGVVRPLIHFVPDSPIRLVNRCLYFRSDNVTEPYRHRHQRVSMRIADETRSWAAGRVKFIDDSFDAPLGLLHREPVSRTWSAPRPWQSNSVIMKPLVVGCGTYWCMI